MHSAALVLGKGNDAVRYGKASFFVHMSSVGEPLPYRGIESAVKLKQCRCMTPALSDAGKRVRTFTVAQWILNPSRLPIPPYPHEFLPHYYNISFSICQQKMKGMEIRVDNICKKVYDIIVIILKR